MRQTRFLGHKKVIQFIWYLNEFPDNFRKKAQDIVKSFHGSFAFLRHTCFRATCQE